MRRVMIPLALVGALMAPAEAWAQHELQPQIEPHTEVHTSADGVRYIEVDAISDGLVDYFLTAAQAAGGSTNLEEMTRFNPNVILSSVCVGSRHGTVRVLSVQDVGGPMPDCQGTVYSMVPSGTAFRVPLDPLPPLSGTEQTEGEDAGNGLTDDASVSDANGAGPVGDAGVVDAGLGSTDGGGFITSENRIVLIPLGVLGAVIGLVLCAIFLITRKKIDPSASADAQEEAERRKREEDERRFGPPADSSADPAAAPPPAAPPAAPPPPSAPQSMLMGTPATVAVPPVAIPPVENTRVGFMPTEQAAPAPAVPPPPVAIPLPIPAPAPLPGEETPDAAAVRQDLEKLDAALKDEADKDALINNLRGQIRDLTATVTSVTSVPSATTEIKLASALLALVELLDEKTIVHPDVQVRIAELVEKLSHMDRLACAVCPSQPVTGLHDAFKLGVHYRKAHPDLLDRLVRLRSSVVPSNSGNGGTPAA